MNNSVSVKNIASSPRIEQPTIITSRFQKLNSEPTSTSDMQIKGAQRAAPVFSDKKTVINGKAAIKTQSITPRNKQPYTASIA